MAGLQLSEEQRGRLREIGRAAESEWWVRDRVEMVLLDSEGFSPSEIAEHLGCHPETVRRVLRRFRRDGLAALERRLPGPIPDEERRRTVFGSLEKLLRQERTWTSHQLSKALRRFGVALSARQVRRYLAELGAHWSRTKFSLTHRQNPTDVRRAKRQLNALKKRPGRAGSTCSSSTNVDSRRRSPPATAGRHKASGSSSRLKTPSGVE